MDGERQEKKSDTFGRKFIEEFMSIFSIGLPEWLKKNG